ncbi:MAG: hypothetical protein K8U03_13925 [Planctomycetia bacterium]|nr:hypothetical protein [Planctomycetia bacterium]
MSEAAMRTDSPATLLGENPRLRQVRLLVDGNMRRWKLLTLLEGFGFAVSILLAYLLVVVWLDDTFHLPRLGRILAGSGLLIGLAVIAVGLVRRRRRLRMSEDQVALAIERRTQGGLQNRLINALQLARTTDASSLEISRAVIEENVAGMQRLKLEQAAALSPALVRVGVAGLLVVVAAGFYYRQPGRFTNSAQRILLPFVDVEPIYRTTLSVTPGDIEIAGDVEISIAIEGVRPTELLLMNESAGKRSDSTIPVPPQGVVRHTIRDVRQTQLYAVRGGDFTTPFYRITVPTPANVSLLTARYRYPEYSGLAPRTTESAAGDLEGLSGTEVELTFDFDSPCAEATMCIERRSTAEKKIDDKRSAPPVERLALRSVSPVRFTGKLVLRDQAEYRVESRRSERAPFVGRAYPIRILSDIEPQLQLTGFDGKSETTIDAVLPYRAVASDDWGLTEVGLFIRRLGTTSPATVATDSATKLSDAKGATVASGPAWEKIELWSIDGKKEFDHAGDLTLLSLAAAEGERIELALRGRDRDPAKAERWTEGTVYSLSIGGDAAALQLLYERILRTETELKQVLAEQRRILVQTVDWLRKLDGEGGLKWDDPKNITALHTGVGELTKQQAALRAKSGAAARAMPTEAGSLQMSVGLLADTEMVRAERIFESLPTRDLLQAKRSAIADAQLTEQRTIVSLQQILDGYATFRFEWELDHLTGFAKMLAERQTALHETSLINAARPRDKPSEPWQASAVRRQEKLTELVALVETGFIGIGEKLADAAPEGSDASLATAFTTAGEAAGAGELTAALAQSAELLKAGKWNDAASRQQVAAAKLTALHDALRKAQVDAAQAALKALEEMAKGDVAAQQAIEKLKAGTDKQFGLLPEKMPVKDLIEMREKLDLDKKGGPQEKTGKVTDYTVSAKTIESLNRPDGGKRQDFDVLKLGGSKGQKTPSYPGTSDTESNVVNAPVQEELKDLVGALLEEADEMQKNFETSTLNTAFNINEAGEVGKLGGDMNSFAAAATTGNKKPPTRNVGGASRSGRRGARAHGVVVGDESVNRRGRDQVQEGQERVADQAGLIKETMSGDPQNDTSTGVGGKRVQSDDTKFSTANVGKWTDDMANRMGKPQNKNYIVERQDGRMDPQVAEMLRDMTSRHEQIIERVKAIRKELKNLYLPTDHLDAILAELQGQLDQLKERPTAEVFRLQNETLDKLRGTVRVFQQPASGFQPSLPREQVVRGRVLDDADRPPPPEYAEAIKRYYERLSSGAGAKP